MSSTQEMLEMAVELYGLDDIVTRMLSIKRDKEIVAEQRALMERDLKCTG